MHGTEEETPPDCTDWLIAYVRARLGEHTKIRRLGDARLRAIVEVTLEGLTRAPNGGIFTLHCQFESDPDVGSGS